MVLIDARISGISDLAVHVFKGLVAPKQPFQPFLCMSLFTAVMKTHFLQTSDEARRIATRHVTSLQGRYKAGEAGENRPAGFGPQDSSRHIGPPSQKETSTCSAKAPFHQRAAAVAAGQRRRGESVGDHSVQRLWFLCQ